MRDSEGRLLGAVTTLEDVTSLQDTDRFKTQFIEVASARLRDPLLQLRRGLYALTMGFAGELRPLQAELVTSATQEAQKLDDLMADLIEVAELDSGKREPQLERLLPLRGAGGGAQSDDGCGAAREESAWRFEPLPISRTFRPTAARCERFSTTC